MCRGVVSVCPRHPWQVHLLSECKNPKIRLSVSLAGRVELPDFLSTPAAVDQLSRSFALFLLKLHCPLTAFFPVNLQPSESERLDIGTVIFLLLERENCSSWSSENWRVTETQSQVVNAITSLERIENGQVPAEFPFRHGYQIENVNPFLICSLCYYIYPRVRSVTV